MVRKRPNDFDENGASEKDKVGSDKRGVGRSGSEQVGAANDKGSGKDGGGPSK
jgi:hypothetical protein